MDIDTNIIIYALLALATVLMVWVIRLETRFRRLLRGKDARSIEDTVVTVQKELDDYKKFKQACVGQLANVEKRLGRSVAGVKTIRYNPFKGSGGGGNQSFSTAFVDEYGNGVVITCLHARERVSVFSKPVERLGSSFELTEEEMQAIRGAEQQSKL